MAEAIKSRQNKENAPLIANRQDRQAFWSKVMYDEDQIMKNRLKASELLGKSEADFTEIIQHEGLETLSDKMKAARERAKKK